MQIMEITDHNICIQMVLFVCFFLVVDDEYKLCACIMAVLQTWCIYVTMSCICKGHLFLNLVTLI